ncbi:hypothetical protein ACJ77P_10105 [Syntrophus buswellii]|uniref:hypothetical protein n=1 Tax=Syntrophus buswellii TaxID=43774 RepID=UPI0038D49A4F
MGKEGRKQPPTALLKWSNEKHLLPLLREEKVHQIAFLVFPYLFILGKITFRKKKLVLICDSGLIRVTGQLLPLFFTGRFFFCALLTHGTTTNRLSYSALTGHSFRSENPLVVHRSLQHFTLDHNYCKSNTKFNSIFLSRSPSRKPEKFTYIINDLHLSAEWMDWMNTGKEYVLRYSGRTKSAISAF